MIDPQDFERLTNEQQASYLARLSALEFVQFSRALVAHNTQMLKQAEQFTGQVKTTDLDPDLKRYKRKLGKGVTLVDIIAEFPELKQNQALLALVRADFDRIIGDSKRSL
jgi:hypothetical protein